MPSSVLTLAQVNDLIHEVTAEATGYDNKHVRLAYQQQSQPARDIDQNVVYFWITPVGDPYDKARHTQYGINDADEALSDRLIFYTRVMQVHWTFYGPDSFDAADALRHGLLTDGILAALASSKVYPITEIEPPARVPELFNNQWWERVDVKALFNVATLRSDTIPYLTSAPITVPTADYTAEFTVT